MILRVWPLALPNSCKQLSQRNISSFRLNYATWINSTIQLKCIDRISTSRCGQQAQQKKKSSVGESVQQKTQWPEHVKESRLSCPDIDLDIQVQLWEREREREKENRELILLSRYFFISIYLFVFICIYLGWTFFLCCALQLQTYVDSLEQSEESPILLDLWRSVFHLFRP